MPSQAVRRTAALALLAGLTVGLAGCAVGVARPPTPPKLRAGTLDQIGPRLTNYGAAVVPQGAVITVWGDDFATAAAPETRSKAKKISLADALARATGLQVVDHSSPGQTIAQGLDALSHGEAGRLVVVCYGYGDRAAATKDFKASVDAMIRLAHSRGVPIILVTEPLPVVVPSTKPTTADKAAQALTAQVLALQDVVRAEAPAEGAGLVDSTSVLNPPPPTPNAQNINALTPAEKQPGSPLATARIAHAIASEIELAQ